MEQWPKAIMFWPKITYDIHTIRSKFSDCNRNVPSKAELCSEAASSRSKRTIITYAIYSEFWETEPQFSLFGGIIYWLSTDCWLKISETEMVSLKYCPLINTLYWSMVFEDRRQEIASVCEVTHWRNVWSATAPFV